MKQESLKFSGRASNPAKRKFSPAQLAAQKLFAERARAGTLKKDWLSGITPEHEDYDIFRYYLDEKKNLLKTLGKGKRKANPGLYDNINAKRARIAAGSGERMRKPGSKGAPTQEAFEQSAMTAKRNPNPYNPYASRDMLEEYSKKTDAQLRYIIKDAGAAAVAQRGMQSEMKYLDQVNDANTVLYRRSKGLNEITGSKIAKMKIEGSQTPDNPEGVIVTEAGALRFSKQNMPSDLKKAGFVASVFPGARGWVINYSAKGGRKINPDKSKPRAYVRRASQITGAPPSKRLVSRRKMALSAPEGYFPNPKVKYTNRAKDMRGERRVGYAVHMADNPSYLAIAWFSKKDDAVKVAQEASDRTGKQLAVTRVQNYFGAM